MLILTRRFGESLMIGDSVKVTVLGVKRGQVSIGINAPQEISVHREEVYERIGPSRNRGPPPTTADRRVPARRRAPRRDGPGNAHAPQLPAVPFTPPHRDSWPHRDTPPHRDSWPHRDTPPHRDSSPR